MFHDLPIIKSLFRQKPKTVTTFFLNFRRLNIDFTIDDQPQRKSYGQSFTNYGPGYRRPLGTVPNFDAKFGEAKNYNNPRFNIRGQQIHYSKKILILDTSKKITDFKAIF